MIESRPADDKALGESVVEEDNDIGKNEGKRMAAKPYMLFEAGEVTQKSGFRTSNSILIMVHGLQCRKGNIV